MYLVAVSEQSRQEREEFYLSLEGDPDGGYKQKVEMAKITLMPILARGRLSAIFFFYYYYFSFFIMKQHNRIIGISKLQVSTKAKTIILHVTGHDFTS